jgi:hypothetical protein
LSTVVFCTPTTAGRVLAAISEKSGSATILSGVDVAAGNAAATAGGPACITAGALRRPPTSMPKTMLTATTPRSEAALDL